MPLKELEDLKNHMTSTTYFHKKDPRTMTEEETLAEYREYLLDQLAVAFSPELMADHSETARDMMRKLSRSDLFKDLPYTAITKAKWGSHDYTPDDVSDVVHGPYVDWLMKKLDVLNRIDEEKDAAHARDVTGSADTAKMKRKFTQLKEERISKAPAARTAYEKAKSEDAAAREKVKQFLGVKDFGLTAFHYSMETQDAVLLLSEKTREIEALIKKKKEAQANTILVVGEKEEMEFLETQLKQGNQLIRELRQSDLVKSEARTRSHVLQELAVEDFKKIDTEFRAQNKKFIDGIKDLARTVKAEEGTLRQKKEELDKLVAQIESTVKKAVDDENALRDRVNRIRDRYDSIERNIESRYSSIRKKINEDINNVWVMDNRPRARKLAAIEELTRQREEQERQRKELSDRLLKPGDQEVKREEDAVQPQIDRLKIQMTRDLAPLRAKLPILGAELSLIDTRYSVLRDCVDEITKAQVETVGIRNELREELDWIKKLKKVDKALNIYCSCTKVCFPLLVNIGNLVAGDGCGILGKFLVGGVSTASAVRNVLSSPRTMADMLTTTLSGGVGVVASIGPLARIEAHDTGAFFVNLMLGLSYGKALAGGAGPTLKGGIALKYTAGISQEDDRHFRTIFTLTVEPYGEFSIPTLLEAEISGELFTETTGMIFQDVYHWAAWLAQKWGNIAAMLRGAKFFDVTDKYGVPDSLRKEHMMEMARIRGVLDPQLNDIFQQTMKYVSLPVIRTLCRDKLGGASLSASLVETFGAGISLGRKQDPEFYKLVKSSVLSADGHLEKEVCKKGEQKTESISITIPGGKGTYSYSYVDKHAVWDNDGTNHVFSLVPSGLKNQTSVQKTEPELPDKVVPWIQNMEDKLKPLEKFTGCLPANIVNSVQECANLKFITQIAGASGSDGLQFNFFRSALGRKAGGESRIVLMYIRPVLTAGMEVKGEAELGVPGLNADFGLGVQLTRTFCETLGDNTLTYVQMVFNGFMNITDLKATDDPRPEEARGTFLWRRWAEKRGNSLCRIMARIGGDNGETQWVTREVKALGGLDLIRDAKKNLTKFQKKQVSWKGLGKGKTVPVELEPLENFLYGCWKSQADADSKSEDWQQVPLSKFQWTVSPIVVVKEIARTFTQAYRLDKAICSLGPRCGLRELYAKDAEARRKAMPEIDKKTLWVPDSQVTHCGNPKCRKKFSITLRKHHCRRCGKIFCAECVRFRMELPERGYEGKQMVCEKCFHELVAGDEKKAERGRRQEAAKGVHDKEPDDVKGADAKGEAVKGDVVKPTGEKGDVARGADAKGDTAKSSGGKGADIKANAAKPDAAEVGGARGAGGDGAPAITGYTLIRTIGDGNCLFRSVSQALFDNQNRHMELRQQTVEHMRRFSGDVGEKIQMENLSDYRRANVVRLVEHHPTDFVNYYLEAMSRSGEWGGWPELWALGRVLGRPVILHKTAVARRREEEAARRRAAALADADSEHAARRRREEEERRLHPPETVIPEGDHPDFPFLAKFVEEQLLEFWPTQPAIHLLYSEDATRSGGHFDFLKPLHRR